MKTDITKHAYNLHYTQNHINTGSFMPYVMNDFMNENLFVINKRKHKIAGFAITY